MMTDQTVFVAGISGLFGMNFALAARDRAHVTGAYATHPVAIDGLSAVQMDLTDARGVEGLLRELAPALVVNAAGLTNVDQCESDPALARRLNVELAVILARTAESIGARMIHLSTDHLSDGLQPFRRESDPLQPLNVYAETKLEAEGAVLDACPSALVARTTFFGWGPPHRPSFSDWILDGLREGRQLRMFEDVWFTPILVNDLIDVLFESVEARISGLYNIAGPDRVSKYEFARRLALEFREDVGGLSPASVAGFPFRARRPADMSLVCTRIEDRLGRRMPPLSDGLMRLRQLEDAHWPSAVRPTVDPRRQ